MKNKKKVAFLLSIITERGGIGRVTSLLSNELSKLQGLEIHIISYVKKDTTSYDWNNDLPYHYLLENQIPMKKGIVKASSKLRAIISNNHIDILIACGQIVGPLGVFGTLFKKTRLIYWSHTSFKGASKKQFRLFNEHFTAVFAKCVVSLTKTDEVNYQKETRAKKVIQIYNPIDSKLEAISKNYRAHTKKIISVGRLSYEKNFESIVDIVKIVITKHPDISWHIYGSGEYKDKIEKKIAEEKMTEKIILMGQSNQLYELYNDYSIMVMTSRYEGFPMSLLEGLASNLPLISFNVPTGPNEIIREGINGYLITPFEIDEMAQKIISLLDNPTKMEEFSLNNQKFLKEYNLDSILNQWEKLLSES